MVLANRDKQPNVVLLQKGRLNFDEKITFGTGADETRSVAVGDMNNDGYLDIITGNLVGSNYVYFGNGIHFDLETAYEKADLGTASVKVADLNQDGFLDIVNANGEDTNFAYLNSEDGSFTKIPLDEKKKYDTYDIHLVDINGDSFVDILEANSGNLNLYYLNTFGRTKN